MKQQLTSEEEKTLEFYQKSAEKWAEAHRIDLDCWRSQFENFNKLLSEGKIIDVGCGHGRDALFLNKQFKYIGIDISSELIEQARKLVPDADFRVMSMYNLDFPEHTFDGFWASAFFLHIPKSKIDDTLGKLKKVLKPNAIGFIAMKEGKEERMVADKLGGERFFAFYQQEEFAKVLERNSFEVLESTKDLRKYNPPQNLTVWLLYFIRAK